MRVLVPWLANSRGESVRGPIGRAVVKQWREAGLPEVVEVQGGQRVIDQAEDGWDCREGEQRLLLLFFRYSFSAFFNLESAWPQRLHLVNF
jgi:hypothetical protein